MKLNSGNFDVFPLNEPCWFQYPYSYLLFNRLFFLVQFYQPTHYVTITTRRNSTDTTDSPDVERVHLKKLVGQLKNNLYNVSVLSEPDLEMITNMDPNSVADITGKDFIEQLKEVSGRLAGDKSIACDL